MSDYDDKRENAYDRVRQTGEEEQEREEFVKNSLSPYKEIAIDALMSWNGLSEEEATKVARESTNEQLESQVYAEGSINYALEGIQSIVQKNYTEQLEIESKGKLISDEEIAKLKDAIMNGPVDASIFHKVGEYFKNFNDYTKGNEVIKRQSRAGEEIDWKEVYKASNESSSKNIISILSHIHDGWVKDNQKKFMARDKKYQHMPIELIGWKEAKADLLFLRPILSAMNVGFSEEVLEEFYNERVQEFLKEKGITDVTKLTEQISKGAEFYPALDGQEGIIEALQDTKFVEQQVVSGIKDKGIGTNELISQQLFGEKIIEGADELENLRDQKQQLVEQAKTISETEKLIEAKENQSPNLEQ